jgi:hypothetical protein
MLAGRRSSCLRRQQGQGILAQRLCSGPQAPVVPSLRSLSLGAKGQLA